MLNGAYFAENLGSANAQPSLTSAIADYYLRLQNRSYSQLTKSVALRQLYGEYAPLIRDTLRKDSQLLQHRIASRFNRRSMARSIAALGPGSSDDAYASFGQTRSEMINRVWGGGFGNWIKQDSQDQLFGYDYDTYGVALGYDRLLSETVTLGFAAAYAKGRIDIDELITTADIETLNASVYGEYRHETGLFARANAGYGHGWNDYDVTMVLGGDKSGSFDTNAFFADMTLGYDLALAHGITITPSVGLDYGYFRSQAWLESLTSGSGLIQGQFAATSDTSLDIPLTLAIGKLWQCGNAGFVHLEGRATYIYATRDNRSRVNAGFAGTAAHFPVYGIDPGKNRWQLGAGLECRLSERLDLGQAYDFEFQNHYQSHSLSVNLGISF